MLNAAGRAPMEPTRRFLSPRTTWHTLMNHARSFANSPDFGASVCSVVSEYGMPYCRRLLQADILPQKLSRRSRIDMREGVSGVAWTSTGTRRSANRSVSAMARSSPKFGSVTTTPPMSSR